MGEIIMGRVVWNDGRSSANDSWYRGEHTNFIADKINLKEDDAIRKYILHGWLPEKPFITKDNLITAFCSCFAQNVQNYLNKNGYKTSGHRFSTDAYIVKCGAGINTTFAMRQQFEWAFEDKTFSKDLWYDGDKILNEQRNDIKEYTKKTFQNTDVFVLTLGLSEVWYNKQTNEVFWRGIPKSQFNPDIHGFKVSSFKENYDNLEVIYNLIRKHKPNSTIIFSVSPVPLIATFRPNSCITSNSVSKAILRTAVDELYRNKDDDNLYYWPSYEVVTDFYTDSYVEDNRHPKQEIIDTIMGEFGKAYLI